MNEEQFKIEFMKRWGREPKFGDCLGECEACHYGDRDLLSKEKI